MGNIAMANDRMSEVPDGRLHKAHQYHCATTLHQLSIRLCPLSLSPDDAPTDILSEQPQYYSLRGKEKPPWVKNLKPFFSNECGLVEIPLESMYVILDKQQNFMMGIWSYFAAYW